MWKSKITETVPNYWKKQYFVEYSDISLWLRTDAFSYTIKDYDALFFTKTTRHTRERQTEANISCQLQYQLHQREEQKHLYIKYSSINTTSPDTPVIKNDFNSGTLKFKNFKLS